VLAATESVFTSGHKYRFSIDDRHDGYQSLPMEAMKLSFLANGEGRGPRSLTSAVYGRLRSDILSARLAAPTALEAVGPA
jgi:hypothetical protein